MTEYGTELIEKRVKDRLVNELNRTGILFRLFSRIKDSTSIDEKFTRKSYTKDGELMQDLIGFRITTYFHDDLKIIVDLCERLFGKLELVYDEPDTEIFRPLRKNMICRFPEDENNIFAEIKKTNEHFALIDSTFEIQFRTTLSEGWHEVDHLMRYKCKEDWVDLTSESRMLNGIYATLETNDQALKALFDDIAYHHYKNKKWEAMLRNQLRLRFLRETLDEGIVSYLNEKNTIGRKIFKINRCDVINLYVNSTLSLSMTFNNWIYLINYCYLKDEFITSVAPEVLIEEFNIAFDGHRN